MGLGGGGRGNRRRARARLGRRGLSGSDPGGRPPAPGRCTTTAGETVTLGHALARLAVLDDDVDAMAVDAHGASSALLLVGGSDHRRLGAITLGPETTGADLTRP